MPSVLTTASTVLCGLEVTGPPPLHGGKVASVSSAKLRVNSNPVLLKSSIDGKTIVGCKTPPASDASGPTAKPCSAVSSVPPGPGVTAGEATKLKTGGEWVMLDTLAGITDGMVGKVTPQTLLFAIADQNKLMTI